MAEDSNPREEIPKCEECKSLDIQDDENGFPVCMDCGLMQSNVSIDYGKDNRVFAMAPVWRVSGGECLRQI